MTKLLFFCGIGLLLPSVTDDVLAQEPYTIAQRKSPNKTTGKKRKRRNRHTVTTNILSPFILRLLYAPSYRFLTKEQRDNIDEANDENDITLQVSRIFPIATGVEGEFAFSDMLSLAIGGNFSYQGEVFSWEAKDQKIEKFKTIEMDVNYYEFTVNSSLYVNANYFKLGPGIGLTFAKITRDLSEIEDDKTEKTINFNYKKISANFSLRRDFFSPQGVGVGIGLTAKIYLTDMLDKRLESKECIGGKECKTETQTDDDFDKDEDNQGIYSSMLMPMIYLVF